MIVVRGLGSLMALLLLAQAPGAPTNVRLLVSASSTDPNVLEFIASPDPVMSYVLRFYRQGDPTPIAVVDVGQPPVTGGKFSVPFTDLMAPFAIAGVTYEARLFAVGPRGESPGAPSNGFTFSACSPMFSPAAGPISAAGGTITAKVIAAPACAWSVSSEDYWLSPSMRSGIGSQTFTIEARASDSSRPRTGAVTIGGWRYAVTQEAAPCVYTSTPSSIAFPMTGDTFRLEISAPQYCAWTPTSTVPWATFLTGSAVGSSQVLVRASANTPAGSRFGAIQIGSLSVPISQPPLACAFVLTPSLPAEVAVRVEGADVYAWNAIQDGRALERATSPGRIAAAWYGDQVTLDVTVAPGRQVPVTLYLADYDASGRVERIEVLDGTTVLDSRTASAFGNGRYLTWTVSGHVRIRLTKTAGSNAVVSGYFLGQATAGSGTRAAFVGADDTHSGTWKATYGAGGYGLAADTTLQSVAAAGGSGTVDVVSGEGCPWTATSSVPWITTTSKGAGSGSVAVTIAPNTGATRIGVLTVNGVSLSVQQVGSGTVPSPRPVKK